MTRDLDRKLMSCDDIPRIVSLYLDTRPMSHDLDPRLMSGHLDMRLMSCYLSPRLMSHDHVPSQLSYEIVLEDDHDHCISIAQDLLSNT